MTKASGAAANVISGRTLVPLGIVISLFGLVAMTANDRSDIRNRVQAVEVRQATTDEQVKEMSTDLRTVRETVIRIDERMATASRPH